MKRRQPIADAYEVDGQDCHADKRRKKYQATPDAIAVDQEVSSSVRPLSIYPISEIS